jgi:hypothetical protein
MERSLTHYRALTLVQEGTVSVEQVNGMMSDLYVFQLWIDNHWRNRERRLNDATAHRHKMQDERYAEIRQGVIDRHQGRTQQLRDKYNAVTPEQIEKVMRELKVPGPIKTAKQIRDEKNR